ncbi:hypothetical protein PIB30_073966 [Stylosanthes scabra]|uniref:Uncharacterized protein n=1 Tax=Stylosanthes scabra TaxID=79078 RepID=A0ABU6TPA8_9FABA|nr:hypothetical protein [Stylosanthes scabra]
MEPLPTTAAGSEPPTLHLRLTAKLAKPKISATTSSSKPPMNSPPSSYDETLRAFQQESKELWEAHKRTESQLTDIIKLLHKFTSQMAVSPQPSQPSSSTQLPSQPLPNP